MADELTGGRLRERHGGTAYIRPSRVALDWRHGELEGYSTEPLFPLGQVLSPLTS